jgi:hypothetical protein
MLKCAAEKALGGLNSKGLVHIPKFRNGSGKILANALMPDFSAASDIILGYALKFQSLKS